MKEINASLKEFEKRLDELEKKYKLHFSAYPNLSHATTPVGPDESGNIIDSTEGKKPEFGFKPKDHVELVTSLHLIDYERGVKMGGTGFWLYKGLGALMEWGLINYFVEEHLKDGYKFILPPHILNYECGFTAGQFPKFADDVYHIKGGTGGKSDRFILPTAETALINYHRDEILNEEELPKKYFAYSPCYRKEAGSYRTGERGMIRGHQFNKVEIFQFTHPEQSESALDAMVNKAEKLVQGLGLHYQVTKLAAMDCSACMAKTYDIEIWIPSMKEYKEVSSASNARDYQARRGNIRFKPNDSKKTAYIHSLNASGLATSRLLPAIVEQFQQKDGSVIVPQVLRKWVGCDILPT